MSEALVFRNFGLAHRRPGGEEVLLEGVDLTLPGNGFFVLIGTSGGEARWTLTGRLGTWEVRGFVN